MKSDLKSQPKTFVDALFENTGWLYFKAPEDLATAEKMEELPQEKKQIIDSLKEFAIKEAVDNKLSFEGGEVRLKPALKDLKSKDELFHYWNELLKPIAQEFETDDIIVHELKESPIKVLWVGDYPREVKGQDQGLTFKGDVRDLLLKMIKAMKLEDKDFALSLVVKVRGFKESKAKDLGRESLSMIQQEIMYYQPQIVMCMGAFATSLLLATDERLSNLHGQMFERELTTASGIKHRYQIMPIFHPEFLLINPNMKKTTWDDLQKAMKTLGL